MHAQALLMATDWHHNVTLTNDASHYMYLHCADPIYVPRNIRYRGLRYCVFVVDGFPQRHGACCR
jgi:hypothetical protein